MSKLATALAQREKTPYERFRDQFERLRPEIAALVGKEKVDRFMRVALNAVQATPDVLGADRRSLLLACMEAAQDGLLPDGREAVFNIYRTKNKERSKAEQRDVWEALVQYLPMVYGLVQLIYEAGATYVDAVAVYQRDGFEYQRGDEPKIVHTPYKGTEEPGPVIAAYVVIKMRTGETKREVMFKRDIEKVRAKSKSPDGLMWNEATGFYDQGAIKSVIHRVHKQLPTSERLARALAKDNDAVGLADVSTSPQESGVADLAALIDGRLDQDLRTVPTQKPAADPVRAEAGAESSAGKPTPATAQADAQFDAGERTATAERKEPAPPPKAGDAGTPELKQRFLNAFKASTEPELLSLKMDEARSFYKWAEADLAEITAAYQARQRELVEAG